MIFGIKEKYNFDLYNVFLAIATNIPQPLKTGFVLQGHILLLLFEQEGHHIYIYIQWVRKVFRPP